MNLLILIALLILFIGYFSGDGPNNRQPYSGYIHKANHPKNVGCGSCIYNPLDPNSDGVLPDWQRTLRVFGKTRYKSPPLDSQVFKVQKECENL